MIKTALGAITLALLAACASAPEVTPAVRSELAPTGKLRAGINFGNVLLTAKDPVTGEPRGVAVDLARELARRLEVPLEIVPHKSAGHLAEAVKTGVWDVAFLAVEPQRANVIAFTAPYAEIEATYLVPPGSPLRRIEDVDRKGVRISLAAKSAYDLYLSRTIKNAQLVRIVGGPAAFKLFVDEQLEAHANLRPILLNLAPKLPGSRILDGRFSVVGQAAGTHPNRAAGAKYLRDFVEDIKSSGLVAQLIEKNGVRGLTVAPLAEAPSRVEIGGSM
jgi:polar amino acid transport system substrate-binding protein